MSQNSTTRSKLARFIDKSLTNEAYFVDNRSMGSWVQFLLYSTIVFFALVSSSQDAYASCPTGDYDTGSNDIINAYCMPASTDMKLLCQDKLPVKIEKGSSEVQKLIKKLSQQEKDIDAGVSEHSKTFGQGKKSDEEIKKMGQLIAESSKKKVPFYKERKAKCQDWANKCIQRCKQAGDILQARINSCQFQQRQNPATASMYNATIQMHQEKMKLAEKTMNDCSTDGTKTVNNFTDEINNTQEFTGLAQKSTEDMSQGIQKFLNSDGFRTVATVGGMLMVAKMMQPKAPSHRPPPGYYRPAAAQRISITAKNKNTYARSDISQGDYSSAAVHIKDLVADEGKDGLQIAAKFLEELKSSGNPGAHEIVPEIELAINEKLKEMGLPEGDLGLQMISQTD